MEFIKTLLKYRKTLEDVMLIDTKLYFVIMIIILIQTLVNVVIWLYR